MCRRAISLRSPSASRLIIIFLVLAAQFESLRDPLVIMISVPIGDRRRA